MAGALLETQKGIYAALAGDTGAGGLRDPAAPMVTGVFDGMAPQAQAFDYVTIGEGVAQRFDRFGTFGADDLIRIHIWSRYAGFERALLIRDRIRGVLEDQAVAVAGWGLVDLREERVERMVDPDGVTRHVVLEYRAIVEPV